MYLIKLEIIYHLKLELCPSFIMAVAAETSRTDLNLR
jgi:hypothetical protein